MRLLEVIPSLDPVFGGTVESLKQLSAGLKGNGHEVEAVTLDDPDSPWLTGLRLKVHALGKGWGKYRYSSKFGAWMRAHAGSYDAVIVNGIWQYTSVATFLALRGMNVPYFVRPAGMLDIWFKKRYPLKHVKKLLYWYLGERRCLERARAVLFSNQEELIRAGQAFDLGRSVPAVINSNGSQKLSMTDRSPARESFLRTYPFLRGKRIVLFLGRVTPKKRCLILPETFKRALKKDDSLVLVIVGPGRPSYKRRLRRRIDSLGIGEKVFWIDFLAGELRTAVYSLSEVFILPSHQENFGMSIVEALACGCPVLISRGVAIWSRIESSGAGLVADDRTAECKKLLERWLSLSYNERNEMRRRARDCFLENFEIKRVAAEFSDQLRKLIR